MTVEQASGLVGGRPSQSAQVYAVGFEAAQPATAAAVANALAAEFVRVGIENQHRQHRLATGFVRRELATAERELREQNREIAEFKRENRGMLPGEQQANLAQLALLQQQRQSLALEIADGEARVITLSSVKDNSPVARLILVGRSPISPAQPREPGTARSSAPVEHPFIGRRARSARNRRPAPPPSG